MVSSFKYLIGLTLAAGLVTCPAPQDRYVDIQDQPDIPHTIEKASDAVVYLDSGRSHGSAVFISPTHALTARHAVKGRSVVKLFDRVSGTQYLAKVVAMSEDEDIALLKLWNPRIQYHSFLPIAKTAAKVQDVVYSIGYPMNIHIYKSWHNGTPYKRFRDPDVRAYPTATEILPPMAIGGGVVKIAKDRWGDTTCVTSDTYSHDGSSGGALVNEAGELVGIIVQGEVRGKVIQGRRGKPIEKFLSGSVHLDIIREFISE